MLENSTTRDQNEQTTDQNGQRSFYAMNVVSSRFMGMSATTYKQNIGYNYNKSFH